jgi:hypothetical protein
VFFPRLSGIGFLAKIQRMVPDGARGGKMSAASLSSNKKSPISTPGLFATFASPIRTALFITVPGTCTW